MITRFSRTGRHLRQLLVVIPLALLIPISAYAGNGTFNNATGEHNFCVSLRFSDTDLPTDPGAATKDELLQSIRAAFQRADEIIRDATDDQHRFGTIRLVEGSRANQTAEYRVDLRKPDASGDPATITCPGGDAGISDQYGVADGRVNLHISSHPADVQCNFADTELGGYTIAHEHGHHSYGLHDEYVGVGGVEAACAATGPGGARDYSTDTEALNYSIMDNYKDRGGAQPALQGPITLNEFCVHTNHDPNLPATLQSHYHGGLSTWEVIAAHPLRPALSPTQRGLPNDEPDPGPEPGMPGYVPHTVQFEPATGGLNVMLLLDRSGSMESNNRIFFAKEAAKVFTNVLEVGDVSLGVSSFSTFSSTEFTPTEIIDTATQDAVISAIENDVNLTSCELVSVPWDPNPVAKCRTNIGGGLQEASAQITNLTGRSPCTAERIILLSDGLHNEGYAPGTVFADLNQENIAVLTVAVGDQIEPIGELELQDIANATGGKYYRVTSETAVENSLQSLYAELAAEVINEGILTREPMKLTANEIREVPVGVEAGVTHATFTLTFADAGDVTLTLRSPSGTVITPEVAGSDPNIDFRTTTLSQIFKVANPEAGIWHMVVTAGGTIVSGNAQALAFAAHDGVGLTVTLSNDQPVYPEAITVEAMLSYDGRSVVGASVEGNVLRPDGSKVALALFDDGDSAHGDVRPDDGIYSGRFANYNDDGSYLLQLKGINVDGRTYPGERLLGTQPDYNGEPVPPFTRLSSATAVVTGVPDYLPLIVEYGPETINLKSNGNYVTAYIEMPGGHTLYDIDLDTLAITEINGRAITPIKAVAKFIEKYHVGDEDGDGTQDLMVKFSRCALQQVLTPGESQITLQGNLGGGGLLLMSKRSVYAKDPGNGKNKGKGKKECDQIVSFLDENQGTQNPAAAASASTSGTGGAAGCSLGGRGQPDPVLPLAALVALVYLARRRRTA